MFNNGNTMIQKRTVDDDCVGRIVAEPGNDSEHMQLTGIFEGDATKSDAQVHAGRLQCAYP